MADENESIQLGGNIELSGFKDFAGGEMIIIKKIVGNHVKKISEMASDFQSIKLNLKIVHGTEKSRKFEIHAMLIADKQYNTEITERNVFFGIDQALKKIITLLS